MGERTPAEPSGIPDPSKRSPLDPTSLQTAVQTPQREGKQTTSGANWFLIVHLFLEEPIFCNVRPKSTPSIFFHELSSRLWPCCKTPQLKVVILTALQVQPS